MISRGALAKLALAASVTIAMAYAIEGALRLLDEDSAWVAIQRAEREGHPFDERARMEVVRDLRAHGIDAAPRIIPAALLVETPDGSLRSRVRIDGEEVLPLAGISRKQVVSCNETGEYPVYASDEHGFRNPPGLWAQAPITLALIGDSFTLGECVPSEASIGGRLRRQFPHTVNLGMGGHGPLLQLATLREYGPELRPETVLWIYFENDLWWFDLGREKQSPLLLRYLDPDFRQGLASLQPQIDASLAAVIAEGSEHPEGEPSPVVRVRKKLGDAPTRAWRFLKLRKLRAAVRSLRNTRSEPWDREPADFELFEEILRLARARTESWGGELIFVYLPGVWSFEGGGSEDPNRDRVLEIAKTVGLATIDVEGPMARHSDPQSLYSWRRSSVIGPPHFNEAGYELAAEVIEDGLRRFRHVARSAKP